MIPNPIIKSMLIMLLLAGCNNNTNKQDFLDVPVPVLTTPASLLSLEKEVTLSGNIEGYKTLRLGFMVAGKIDYVSAEEGGRVLKNSLLASLDPSGYTIAKELADIQLNQLQDEYDRLKSMYDKNSLSESDFARISFGLQQAKAQQKLHAKNLADTKLYSPIDGILLKKLAEAGEITGVGIPLFVVSDIRKVKVGAFIPENELYDIRIGQKAEVMISSLDGVFEGRIIEVGSAADPASRAFLLKIEVDNPGLAIRPGMIAKVSIHSGQYNKLLVIPVEAIQHDYDDQSYVFVVDSLKNRAFRRNISLGKTADGKIEVKSGIAENEIVVSGGQQKLVDGSVITYSK